MKSKQIEDFLKELRDSSDRMYEVFTKGSCARLFFIIKALIPKAKLYWSNIDNHAITKIDGEYYDIGGIMNKDYVVRKEYNLVPESQHPAYALLKYSELEEIRGAGISEKYYK
jgi:hypothetical protein